MECALSIADDNSSMKARVINFLYFNAGPRPTSRAVSVESTDGVIGVWVGGDQIC